MESSCGSSFWPSSITRRSSRIEDASPKWLRHRVSWRKADAIMGDLRMQSTPDPFHALNDIPRPSMMSFHRYNADPDVVSGSATTSLLSLADASQIRRVSFGPDIAEASTPTSPTPNPSRTPSGSGREWGREVSFPVPAFGVFNDAAEISVSSTGSGFGSIPFLDDSGRQESTMDGGTQAVDFVEDLQHALGLGRTVSI